jgi:hypothetical protein
MHNVHRVKSIPNTFTIFVFFQTLLKESNHPLGENWPNLVTLSATLLTLFGVNAVETCFSNFLQFCTKIFCSS